MLDAFLYLCGRVALLPQAAALGGLAAAAGALSRCKLCCVVQSHGVAKPIGCGTRVGVFVSGVFGWRVFRLPSCLAPSSCHACFIM
jgi:hypothetical protein